jgi:micrococcal nuclease
VKLDTPRIGRRVATALVAVAGAVVTALVLDACVDAPAGPTPRSSATRAPSVAITVGHGTPAFVFRVVDGDTVEVRYRGRDLTVRLIGVDTPETVAPGQPVECGGPAASRFTEQQLDGEPVRLEFDVQRIDPYGRTLAYVWLGGRLFNRTLVARGFAQVATYPPDVKYIDVFLAAQRRARNRDRGLWGSCAGTRSLIGPASGSSRCDPSYPTVCIPSPPPDLDCADVRFTTFKVLPPDPQHFDGDHDGVGCAG